MGMFADRYPETMMGRTGMLDLNKTKNGAENADQRAVLAKDELEQMDKFARVVRKGKKPKDLIQSGGGEYPDYFLGHYNAVMNDRQTGYYEHGTYHDKHGLFTAEY